MLLNLLPDGNKVLEAGRLNTHPIVEPRRNPEPVILPRDLFVAEAMCDDRIPHCRVSDLGLKKEVRDLLAGSEQPDLVQTVLLPEDQALRHLPALNLAHRRLDFTHHRGSLSPLQEVRCLAPAAPFTLTANASTANHACAGFSPLRINDRVTSLVDREKQPKNLHKQEN